MKKALLGYAAIFALTSSLNENPVDFFRPGNVTAAPYIKTRKPLTEIMNEESFTLMIEDQAVASTNELLKAFELYFSVVFIFNVEYSKEVRKTSIFLQHFFLEIPDKGVTKPMRNLYAKLVETGKVL